MSGPLEIASQALAAILATWLSIELHWCEGAGHGQVDDVCAANLATWLDDFFGRALASRTGS